MTELRISLPEELIKKIEEHPEIDWTFIVSNAIKKYIKELEFHEEPFSTEELHKLSEYSLKEFLESEPDIYTDQDLIKRY
ncbi:MAG: hypothetical protein EU533_09300 [Promethearchaeota archaeon]|nr:MAG: hypothetical protein EU533_09300 [Candidatus Lokiarchaeota archaeon]